MSLRLNLRTILAYLDDALEPAQAKQIGERISENKQAQELIERIGQVTRKRRLTTPSEAARIDPNTIAEFLDGALPAEQQAELEQICIASDVHLAEVASCHQILSNAKGGPALAPPTARQRMVRLVEEPESALVAGKPPARLRDDDSDEKLLNLNVLVKKTKRYKSYLLIGAGVLGGVLFVVALNQVLQLGSLPPQPVPIAKNDQPETPPEKKVDEVVDKKPAPPVEEKKPATDKKIDTPPLIENPPIEKKIEKEPEPKTVPAALAFPPFAPPSAERKMVGAYMAPPVNQPTILLQAGETKDEWHRLDLSKTEVFSGKPLVSLPGCRSVVNLQTGVRLTLAGNLKEVIPIDIHETFIDLHSHPGLDADLTLKRGRLLIASTREDRPSLVRVRFANPTNPDAQEHMDIQFRHKGAELLIDRFSRFPVNEKFYPDPKSPNRIGPMADMGIFVLSGEIELKFGDVTFGMQGPPGRAQLMWNSLSGLSPVQHLDKLEDFLSANPPLFPGITDAKSRSEMQRARDELSTSLSGKPIEVGLKEARNGMDPYKSTLAVRSFGAIDDARNLLDSLEDKQPAVRAAAILTSRQWIANERDNDYLFYEVLKSKYTPTESEKIMDLLHNVTERQAAMPETYEFLIESLDNPRLIIRELARSHLYTLAPGGRSIPYAADADQDSRRKAQAAWRQVVPAGQLPKQNPGK